MSKRFLTALLAAVVLAGLPATAAAATPDPWEGAIAEPAFSDVAGHEAEGELTLLAAIGVFTGEQGLGGPVTPDDPLTRAQFCKVVVEAFGKGGMAASLSGLRPDFVDEIPAWAWGYVNVATYMGIINGYEDGAFKAGNYVTYGEALTMLIRAVGGHKEQVGPGVWPYNYIFYGVDNGFNGPVDVSFAGLPTTRGDMARMLFSTMQINRIGADGKELIDSAVMPPYWEIEDGPVGTGNLYEGPCVAVNLEYSWIEILDDNYCYLDLGDLIHLVGADTLEGLVNFEVRAVTIDDKVIFVQLMDTTSAVSGVFKELKDTDSDGYEDAIVLKDGRQIPYDETASLAVMINGTTGYGEGDLSEGYELTIMLGQGGLAVNIVALDFDPVTYLTQVTPADEDYDPADETTWTKIQWYGFAFDRYVSNTCTVTINGAAAGAADLAVNDAVQIAFSYNESDQAYLVRAHREVIEGVVKTTSTAYPGPVRQVTLELDDETTRTLTISDDGNIAGLPAAGARVSYGLEFGGLALVDIAYETLTPFVVVRSFTVHGDGTAWATVDVRGVETTYRVADSNIGDLFLHDLFTDYAARGAPIWIQVDTGTGTIVDVAEMQSIDTYWFVLSNSAGNLTLGYPFAGPTAFDFIPADADITVYTSDEEGYTYTPVEDLTVSGDYVLQYHDWSDSYGFDEGGVDLVSDLEELFWLWCEGEPE